MTQTNEDDYGPLFVSLPAGNQSHQTSLPAYSVPAGNRSQQTSLPAQQTENLLTQPDALNMIATQTRPPSYLWQAIMACLCCFWPTGICAIIAAIQANNTADKGDMRKAHKQSKTARNLVILTVALGIVCVIVIIIRSIVTSENTEDKFH